MEVVITEWALSSYLELSQARVFSDVEYRCVIRPDVLRLRTYPDDPKFSNGKFWSVAKDRNSEKIPSGFKMKWHQIGDGKAQLRLTVALNQDQAILCEAYVKNDEKMDRRRLAKFKTYVDIIKQGKYTVRGRLK